MKTTKVEQNFKEYLENIKVYGKPILSPMEIDYLAGGIETTAYEFKQEKGESDEDFLKSFEAWLHEGEVTTGYADYFLFLGLRRHEKLTPWAFKSLEKAVTECFEKGQGWLYEVNHRYRFRLTIRLVISKQPALQRLVRRSTAEEEAHYRRQEREIGRYVSQDKVSYNTIDLYA